MNKFKTGGHSWPLWAIEQQHLLANKGGARCAFWRVCAVWHCIPSNNVQHIVPGPKKSKSRELNLGPRELWGCLSTISFLPSLLVRARHAICSVDMSLEHLPQLIQRVAHIKQQNSKKKSTTQLDIIWQLSIPPWSWQCCIGADYLAPIDHWKLQLSTRLTSHG